MEPKSAPAFMPDNDQTEDLNTNIDLFRGEVNLPVTLVHLPGRGGLELTIRALYRSGTGSQAETGNGEVGGDILGEGWQLSLGKIVVKDRSTYYNNGDNFYMVEDGVARKLHYAGQKETGIRAFRLQNDHWDIRYHSGNQPGSPEIWQIKKEDGSMYIYDSSGIEWGVKWGVWTGSSVNRNGQRYPVAWNLTEIVSATGDRMKLEYEQEEGQIGGNPALTYTRAARLRKITDVCGRTVTFHYARKEALEAGYPEQVPDDGPQAFQLCWQDKYLDHITIANAGGGQLLKVELQYKLYKWPAGSKNCRKKRYLTAIIEKNRENEIMPGFAFDYYIPEKPEDGLANPGALRSVTYPQGGTATYAYKQLILGGDAPGESKKADPPEGKGYVPQVWYGPDYVVITWYNQEWGTLYLDAYNWNGAWRPWQRAKFYAASFQVLPREDFFVFYYQEDGYTDGYKIWICRKKEYPFNEWQPELKNDDDWGKHAIDGGQDVAVAAGKDFVAIYPRKGNGLYIYQWDKRDMLFKQTFLPAKEPLYNASLACCDNIRTVAYCNGDDKKYNEIGLKLYYSDAEGNWREGGEIFHCKAGTLDTNKYPLVMSNFFAVLRYNREIEKYHDQRTIVKWSEGFDLERQYNTRPNSQYDVVISDNMVGNVFYVYRYNGEKWIQCSTELEKENSTYPRQYAYSYDQDVVVTVSKRNNQTYSLLQYNPYLEQWQTKIQFQDDSGKDRAVDQPTVRGRYCTMKNKLYYRNAELEWLEIYTLPAQVDLATLQNRAPYYLAYSLSGQDDSYVLFLADGAVAGEPVKISGEKLYGGWGKEAGASSILVTCRQTDANTVAALYLHRPGGRSADEKQSVRCVSRLILNDGYDKVETSYEYDAKTAVYDRRWLAPGYAAVKVRHGRDKQDGYTEYSFFNAAQKDITHLKADYTSKADLTAGIEKNFALFNGQLVNKTSYHQNGCKVASVKNYYKAYLYDKMENYREPGYLRLEKKREAVFLYAFDLPGDFKKDLVHLDFSEELKQSLKKKGIDLEDKDKVMVAATDKGIWTLSEKETELEWVVRTDNTALKVYGAVTTETQYFYNEHGQLRDVVTDNHDSEGKRQELKQLTRHGWEGYPEMQKIHLLTPVAEIIKRSQTSPGDKVITIQRTVTTWKNWNSGGDAACWAPHKTYVWDGTTEKAEFRFDSWSGSGEPDGGWIKTGEVLAVTPAGLPVATADIDGVRHLTLYDSRQQFKVAGFANAGREEAGYYGFEEYEDRQGWELYPDNKNFDQYIARGHAHTGECMLVLPGKAAEKVGLRKTFRLQSGRAKCVLSCYAKTEHYYDSGPGKMGWEITLKGRPVNGRPPQASTEKVDFAPVGDTGGKWRHWHHVIELDQQNFLLDSLEVLVYNQRPGTDLMLDDIAFLPLPGDFSATVYDSFDRLPTVTLNLAGNTRRMVYDALRQPAGVIDYRGNPVSLTAAYRCRRFAAAFNPAKPNSMLNIRVRTEGNFANFRHGDEWLTNWQASPGWKREGGRLIHYGADTGDIALQNADNYRNYGVRLKLAPLEVIDRPIGIRIGAISLTWFNGYWTLYVPTYKLEEVARYKQKVMDSKDWLLLIGDHGLLFFADGRKILQHVFERPVSGSCAVFTGNRIALDYIMVFRDPEATVTYLDGYEKPRQAQSLDDNAVLVSAVCYDHLGRAAILTKPARFVGILPGYRTDFIKKIDWKTGVMSGEIHDKYPDDEGYPYSRQRFDASPLAYVLEAGTPGKTYAINLTVAEAQRRTTQKQYALNGSEAFIGGLPAHNYTVLTELDLDKVPKKEIRDCTGRLIASSTGESGKADGVSAITRNHYDAYGNKVKIELPNAFRQELADREKFVHTMEYDFFGRLTKQKTPDTTQPFRYLYDKAGRVRFVQDPNGAQAEKEYILFRLYDELGRVTEEGVCQHAWDEKVLKGHASDRNWPPEAQRRWSRKYQYDGDGTDSAQFGRLTTTWISHS